MQVLPDEKSGRLTAILLLVIVLIAIYKIGFHWFFQRHAEYAEQIDGLSEQLARFEAAAVQRVVAREQLVAPLQRRLRGLQLHGHAVAADADPRVAYAFDGTVLALAPQGCDRELRALERALRPGRRLRLRQLRSRRPPDARALRRGRRLHRVVLPRCPMTWSVLCSAV